MRVYSPHAFRLLWLRPLQDLPRFQVTCWERSISRLRLWQLHDLPRFQFTCWGAALGAAYPKNQRALCHVAAVALASHASPTYAYASTLGKLILGKLDMVHASESLPSSMRTCLHTAVVGQLAHL